MNIRTQVRQFMQEAGQPVFDEPRTPTAEEVKLRVKLVAEEFVELLEAVWPLWVGKNPFDNIKGGLEYLQTVEPQQDLAEVADALADIDYVVEGMRQTFGINGPAVAREVHEANMRKFEEGSYKREDGKHMKPPDWKPPNIEKALANQNDPYRGTDLWGCHCATRHYRGFELHSQDAYLWQKTEAGHCRHMKMLDKILDDQLTPIDWIEITPAFIIVKPKAERGLRIYEV